MTFVKHFAKKIFICLGVKEIMVTEQFQAILRFWPNIVQDRPGLKLKSRVACFISGTFVLFELMNLFISFHQLIFNFQIDSDRCILVFIFAVNV